MHIHFWIWKGKNLIPDDIIPLTFMFNDFKTFVNDSHVCEVYNPLQMEVEHDPIPEMEDPLLKI